jgi:hypothetical protein
MPAVCGLTFELTPTAEAGRLARAVQHKPAHRAGKVACRSGSGAERGVRPRGDLCLYPNGVAGTGDFRCGGWADSKTHLLLFLRSSRSSVGLSWLHT